MRTAKLSSECQLVIPAEVRHGLGLQPGDTLNVAVEGERIVISKKEPLAALERLRSLGRGQWWELEDEIERSRAEWDEDPRAAQRADDDLDR